MSGCHYCKTMSTVTLRTPQCRIVVADHVQLHDKMALGIVECGPADWTDSVLRQSYRRKAERGNVAAPELLRSLRNEVDDLVVLVGDDDAPRIALVSGDVLTAKGYGLTRPVADNATESGRALAVVVPRRARGWRALAEIRCQARRCSTALDRPVSRRS